VFFSQFIHHIVYSAEPFGALTTMFNSITEKAEVSAIEDSKSGEEGNTASLSDLDGRIQVMAKEYPKFYKNHNLLILYLLIIPGCLVPSLTLGFDSAMMNGLQSVPAWDNCQ
jgi:hypothetical protein